MIDPKLKFVSLKDNLISLVKLGLETFFNLGHSQ